MDIDQISGTQCGERQVLQVVSNHLANPDGTGDCRVQRSILSRLASDCRVVFFQLYIRRGLFAQPNLYPALSNLGPCTIQGTIPVAAFIVLIPWNRPGCVG